MSAADRIMELALMEPSEAIAQGEHLVAELSAEAYRDRAVTLRAMSLASRHLGRIADSIEFASSSVEAADQGGLDELRALGRLTMSGSLAVAGRVTEALAVIDDELEKLTTTELVAKFTFQRGAVLGHLGRRREAVEAFERVLPTFRRLGDLQSALIVLDQLGTNLIALGRLDEAEAFLVESRHLAIQLGERAEIHGIDQNLGEVAAYRGDLPTALELLTRSDQEYMKLTGAPAPQHVARCEVLITAGLFGEALRLAKQIAAHNHRTGDVEHESNALLVAATAAMFAGEFDEAISLSDAAVGLFGDSSRALEARRVGVEAALGRGEASYSLLTEAESISGRLRDEGNVMSSGQADLLAGRIALALGDEDRAASTLGRVASLTTGPIETRVQSRMATATLRLMAGDRRGAAAAARAGLAMLDRYQAAIGASDLRSGIERQGAELAAIGLRLAVESGRPRRMLAWLDRTRARALRFRPIVSQGDEETRKALTELRRVESRLRRPTDRLDPGLLRQRRWLQEQVTQLDRRRRGTYGPEDRFTVDEVINLLGDFDLLEIGSYQGDLLGVLLRRGRARLVRLGRVSAVVNESSHVRFALRRAARLGRPVDHASLMRLDRMLFGDLDLSDGGLVVVPPPELMALPWSGLPSMRDRPLNVVPSAEMWWRAARAGNRAGHVLVAGGPDLEMAERELAVIAKLYQDPVVVGPDSRVEEVRSGLDGASIAHIASHATFQVENPMFSSLRLGDGDLNVYEIERLRQPPGIVVLSACDSGYTEARVGDELTGLTSALLSMGTRTVVASVGLVPDSPATPELMAGLHKGLSSGLPPAEALAWAQARRLDDPDRFVAAASFICVGA